MRLKLIISIIFVILLLGLLAASLYVVRQNQDIRQRAANDNEYMVVTPATQRKGRVAQVAVVLNKLDPKFQYRLVFDLNYEGSSSLNAILDKFHLRHIRKSIRVTENKTYKYKFLNPSCRATAKLSIQLYYRDSSTPWKPVNAPGTTGNTQLQASCKQITVVVPTPDTSTSSESAQQSPAASPTIDDTAVETDEGGLTEVDPDAQPIEDLEDAAVLDQESGVISSPSPSPIASPQATPSSSATVRTNSPTPNAIGVIHISPSPSATTIASPSPSTLAIASPTTLADAAVNTSATPSPSAATGGFGALLASPTAAASGNNSSSSPANSNNSTASRQTNSPTTTTSKKTSPLPAPSSIAVALTASPASSTTTTSVHTDATTQVALASITPSVLPTPTVSITTSGSSWWKYLLIGAGVLVSGGVGVLLLL